MANYLELEDLQIKAMSMLPDIFKQSEIQEEDVVTFIASSLSTSTSLIIHMFSVREVDEKIVKTNLYSILFWTSVYAHILNITLPYREDLMSVESADPWPDEVLHCGILASLMLQYKASELTLDYYLSEKHDIEEMQSCLWDVVSLVDVLAERIGVTFKEVLNNKDGGRNECFKFIL